MEWVETTGRTVAEAKEAALDQLGVDEHDAEFEVLAEPRSGLFGRMRAEARIRARVRPTRPRPKEDRSRRRQRSDSGRSSSSTAGGAGSEQGPPARGAGEATRGSAGSQASPRFADSEGTSDLGPATQRTSRRRRRARSRPTGSGDVDSVATNVRGVAPRSTGEDDKVMTEDVPLEEQGEVARDFLAGLLERFDAGGGAVEVRHLDEETVELAVTGEDLGLLIGPKGATLQAVQELTRTVVQRQTGGHNGRLLVDIAGYREKRKAALERFAREVADDVLATGTQRVLEPMQPADRKIVHDLINTIEGVTTTSEGEEPRRRVVILPSS